MTNDRELTVIADCNGCGVCCFHMGYPPFIRPALPMSAEEVDTRIGTDDGFAKAVAKDPLLREDLERGREGESWWHCLPEKLRAELDAYIASYDQKEYGNDVSSFDGPCFWLDSETRLCKNHLHRPNVCRDFETGSKKCLEWRNYYIDKVKQVDAGEKN